MADIHKDRVIASNESLWNSQKYSDITIRCGFDEYKLHRAIICPRSTFFAAACKGEFMEANTATIKLDDDDPETVKRMLLYLYTLDYADGDVPDAPAKNDAAVDHDTPAENDAPAQHVDTDRYHPPQLRRKNSTTTEEETDSGTTLEPLLSADPHDSRMMNNVLVYAIAEKYDIPELKQLAKRKFEILACSKWPHDDFHAVIEVAFSTTPDGDMGLRRIVLDICEDHFQDILKQKESRAGFLINENVAAVVLDAATRKIDDNKMLLDGAFARQVVAREELSIAKANVSAALDEKHEWENRFALMLRNILSIKECRHCQYQFGCNLEQLGHTSLMGMQLRCASCRTKHAV